MRKHKPATIVDVARVAGVSTATVSRVLNGETRVGPELVERVNHAMAETNYIRNSYGRALRRQRSDTWAVIVSDFRNPFFTSLVAEVERGAVEAGVSVMLCNTDEDLDRENAYIEAAISQRMAGVVISVASREHSDLSRLAAAHVPTVTVDRIVHDFHGDSLVLDNRAAGDLAAEHVLALGHERILVLAGPCGVNTTEDRIAGVEDAVLRHGIDRERNVRIITGLRAEGAHKAAAEELGRQDPATAILALNGPLTAGAYRGIQECEVAVPEKVSLVGFDDDYWTRMVDPGVTLIAQPVEEMGRMAAQRLLLRMQNPEVSPEQRELAPELVVRGSTALAAMPAALEPTP